MKDQSEHIEYLDLVVRYLAGEASREEIQLLEEWKQAETGNKLLFEEYRKIWKKTAGLAGLSRIDLNREWDKLESRINAMGAKTGPLQGATGKEWSYPRFILRIAAVILILTTSVFGAIYLSKNLNYTKVITSLEKTEIVLPDNSVITLNINSSLKYHRKFDKKERSVVLTGEAFFDVEKDSDRPFVIHTGTLEVEVLGTSFNVDAYPENEIVEIVVESGKVAVTKQKNKTEELVLDAGEKGAYSRSARSFEKSVNRDVNYLSWKTRKLIFVNESLAAVINIINKVYNSQVIIRDEALGSCHITASFDNQSLEAIINVLINTLNLEMEIKGEVIEISGDEC